MGLFYPWRGGGKFSLVATRFSNRSLKTIRVRAETQATASSSGTGAWARSSCVTCSPSALRDKKAAARERVNIYVSVLGSRFTARRRCLRRAPRSWKHHQHQQGLLGQQLAERRGEEVVSVCVSVCVCAWVQGKRPESSLLPNWSHMSAVRAANPRPRRCLM